MVSYISISDYLDSKKAAKEKIKAIDAVIAEMMKTILKGALKDNIQEYWLDDGQSKLKMQYRSVEEMSQSIQGLETVKQIYINQVNGRVVRMIPQINFRKNC